MNSFCATRVEKLKLLYRMCELLALLPPTNFAVLERQFLLEYYTQEAKNFTRKVFRTFVSIFPSFEICGSLGVFISLFPLPLNKYEYKIFNKIGTVKEEVERAKYSTLIICPLIKYISFRIKRKLERKE